MILKFQFKEQVKFVPIEGIVSADLLTYSREEALNELQADVISDFVMPGDFSDDEQMPVARVSYQPVGQQRRMFVTSGGVYLLNNDGDTIDIIRSAPKAV